MTDLKANQDQQHVKDVLVETICLLCRTGLRYQQCLKIQGLLGITIDNEQIVLIQMNESVDISAFSYMPGNSPAPSYSSISQSPDHREHGDTGASEKSASGYQVANDSGHHFGAGVGDQLNIPQNVLKPIDCSTATSGNVRMVTATGDALPADCTTVTPLMGSSLPVTIKPEPVILNDGRSFRLSHLPNNPDGDNVQGYLTTLSANTPLVSSLLPGQAGLLPSFAECLSKSTACDLMALPMSNKNLALLPSNANEVQVPIAENTASVTNGTSVTKVSSATAYGIVDMLTDLREEQVVSEEINSSLPSDNGNCFAHMPGSAAHLSDIRAEGPPVAMAADAAGESDGSCSDESEDDEDSDMSESDSASLSNNSQYPYGSTAQLPSMAQWSTAAAAGGLQRSLSDSFGSVAATSAWSLSPNILSTVMPSTGPHSSAYYQQQILAAAAAAAHNRAARAAVSVVRPPTGVTTNQSPPPDVHNIVVKTERKGTPPLKFSSPSAKLCATSRRLPRRPRESEEKRFKCPYCSLAYYHKKHLKYHLTKKHGM